MKRLLIIITRMYAHQGDNKDEFVQIWHGAANTEHRVFARQTGSQDDYVLVLHGYEYPQHIEVATSRARAQVERATKSTDLLPRLRERRTGVVFHPRQSWTPDAQRQIADGINTSLRAAGAAVDYIEAYHYGSIIDKRLARACLQREDFSSVLDELWSLFLSLAVSRYKRRLNSLTQELQDVISPICNESSWPSTHSDDDAGDLVVEQRVRNALTNARHLVLDEFAERDSVVTLTWEVAEKVDEKTKGKLISALAELENLFSLDDQRYQQAVSLQALALDPRVSAVEKSSPAAKAGAVRLKRVDSDPLNTWCHEVLDSLSDLGQALNE